MKICTNGEKLYVFLRDTVLNSTNASGPDWPNVNEFLTEVAGNHRFALYVRGAIAIHAMRRLLRYWTEEKAQISNESFYVKRAKKIIKSEVFPALNDDLTSRLARLLIRAADSSFVRIPATVRKNVIGKHGTARCYLCDKEIFEARTEDDPEFLTLEHIWPQSMGGDSIEDNLVPACVSCQDDTKDTISWEWINVHNLVLPSDPSERALKSVSRKAKTAKHFEHAIQTASEYQLTMKEALLRIGALEPQLKYIRTGMPITFFDLQTAKGT